MGLMRMDLLTWAAGPIGRRREVLMGGVIRTIVQIVAM